MNFLYEFLSHPVNIRPAKTPVLAGDLPIFGRFCPFLTISRPPAKISRSKQSEILHFHDLRVQSISRQHLEFLNCNSDLLRFLCFLFSLPFANCNWTCFPRSLTMGQVKLQWEINSFYSRDFFHLISLEPVAWTSNVHSQFLNLYVISIMVVIG